MKKNIIKLVALCLSGWISLSLMSFACRQDVSTVASEELKTEIITLEAEAADIEKVDQEIHNATAKVDSLLKGID